jgi:TonB-dependent starch-binding outer membrane protein SusC
MYRRLFGHLLKVSALTAMFILLLPSELFGLPAQEKEQFQETMTISGTVTEVGSGVPLPGVSIQIKGTTNGTVTDIEGKYSITANSGDILVFSFIGFSPQEVAVGTNSVINIELLESIYDFDELIVVGYGVQKKKLNTGATLNVKGDDISSKNTTSAMDALKGISPGVSITQNNGQPGAGSKIYIRGIGTIGNSNPLYIVDGIAVENIDNLSPSDIESIDILKDAASAAIYGSRGANGVILVATRKGRKNAMPVVNYSAYYGIQNIYKGPELLNAQQYTEMVIRANENAGGRPLHLEDRVPDWDKIQSGEWKGTNWFDLITEKNAPVQSHSLNVTGGSKLSTFSLGASYFEKQGILGKQANNDYKRINLRLNSEHILFKAGDRNLITLGENITFTNEKKPTTRTGSIYWSDIHSMLVASPYLPMYATDKEDLAYPYHYAIDWSDRQSGNPIAGMINQSKWNTNNKNTIIGNAYLNIAPIRNLNIHSSLGINNWNGSTRSWTPAYSLSDIDNETNDQVHQDMYSGYTWTATNTVTYSLAINNHNISAMAGCEFIKNVVGMSVFGENDSSIFNRAEYGYLDNFVDLDASNASLARFGGRNDYGWGMASYFGRLSYNYNETYMGTLVMRYDASSNFARGHRWGSFPSISAGWVLSNEDFMASTSNWLNMVKLRASWGQNGNQDIDNFVFLSSISLENVNYFFGPDKDIISTGSTPARVPNELVSWETSEQTDIGLDANFLNNRLQVALDWYRKDTKDWLVKKISSVMDGTKPPIVNGGLIRNKGFETMVRWLDNRGDLKYSITATVAYNKNKVVEIPSEDSIFHGPSDVLSENTLEMFRAEAGYPIGYFWGFETDGLLQNDADVAAYVAPEGAENAGEPYFNGDRPVNQQLPGDVKFVDQNGDGKIDNEDKVMIGNPNPDFIIGLQINLDYRGFFLNLTGNGMLGHQVAKNYRTVDSYRNNWTQYDYDNTWSPENTSGTLPRLFQGAHRNYQNISDIYIYNADFFRISNLTIGYDLSKLSDKIPFKETRVYIAANNLYTLTKYPGMDPEVGYSPTDDTNPENDFPWASGIDLGLYPQSRTFMVGVNITF